MTNQNEKDIITQFWSILWIIFRYSNFDKSFNYILRFFSIDT